MTPAQQAAHAHGYEDARHGRSDFVRRSYSHSDGTRSAYMSGRTAFHADRILGRVAPVREENDPQ